MYEFSWQPEKIILHWLWLLTHKLTGSFDNISLSIHDGLINIKPKYENVACSLIDLSAKHTVKIGISYCMQLRGRHPLNTAYIGQPLNE